MRRLFPMTPTAQKALASKLSKGFAFPTQFLVDGDASDGYTLFYVDYELVGFNLIKNGSKVKTLYCIKRIIEEINEAGTPQQFATLLDMRSFAWATYNLSNIRKREMYRLYLLIKANGFTSTFAAMQAKMWVDHLNDTRNIIRYGQQPTEKSKALGNS